MMLDLTCLTLAMNLQALVNSRPGGRGFNSPHSEGEGREREDPWRNKGGIGLNR